MPDPGLTRPNLCSKHAVAGQAEPAGAIRGGLRADGHPLAGDDPPAPQASGIDRAIRLSAAAAVLAVSGIAAYVSYWHAYAVVRAHGETGITARLEPATIDGLVYASSMVMLYAARHRVPVPSLARWLLALGIAATLAANMAQGWSHGPVGAVVAAWPAVSLVGSTNSWSGSSAPPGRQTARRRQRTSALVRLAVLRRILSQPQPLTASAPEGTSAARQARRGGPRVRAPGRRLAPPAGSVTMRRVRPTLAMTRRWPRTGSACRPATRCRNADSPRCSGAHLAAGREPESPRHGKHRRSQTRRVPRSRLTRKQGPPAVSPERDLTAPGRSGIWAWRSARCAHWVNLDAMRVKGLVWLGMPAGAYAAAVRFFGGTLGFEVAFDAGNTVELAAGNGDRIQLFGPGHRYFECYRSHGASIVPLLEVDDLDQASAELAGGGAELLGGPESDGTWTWLTFRVPEGNIHSLGARMA